MTGPAPQLPSLTVVVAAWNSPIHLRDCLASLLRERATTPFEIIACHAGGRDFDAVVAGAGRHVRGLALDGAATVPILRKAGLARASGAVVAFLEDHARVDAGWASALLAAYASPDVAGVGGPVRQGDGLSGVDWGFYLFDYGRFMPPVAAGAVHELSGINMSFRRAVLDAGDQVMADGVHEGALMEWVGATRNEMRLAPGASVAQYRHDSLRRLLASVFHQGRGYAARRVRSTGRGGRVLRALSCAALPAVLTARRATPAFRARRAGASVRSFVYLFLILVSWSAGECVGYLAGAGDSDSRWR